MTQFDRIAEAMAKARWNRLSDKCNGWAALCSLEREDLTNDAKIAVRQVLAVLPSLGLGIVPLEATIEMVTAGMRAFNYEEPREGRVPVIYRNAVAAAPDLMGEHGE